jgi:hypothetical protein
MLQAIAQKNKARHLNVVRTLAAWCLGRGTFFTEQRANGSLIPAA